MQQRADVWATCQEVEMRKDEKVKPWLWTVLAVSNVAGIAFPLGYYLQTDGPAQIFAGSCIGLCRALPVDSGRNLSTLGEL